MSLSTFLPWCVVKLFHSPLPRHNNFDYLSLLSTLGEVCLDKSLRGVFQNWEWSLAISELCQCTHLLSSPVRPFSSCLDLTNV